MEHIGYFFKRIDNRLKSNADAALGKHGLTFAQSRIIRFLAERGGQTTQKEIEDYAHVSHPTIVGIVTRMEQSGFLSTCTDPSDKRNKVVRLTDKAKDINLEIRRSIDNGERAMLRSFSEEEIEQLRGYLIRICDNLDIDSSPGCKPESGAALGSFGPVVALANLAANLVQVFASADRVLDLLEETPITPEVTNGGNTAFTGAAADHVTFAYGQETILNDLSLTVPKGQIVGITGKSGSGKSTLLRLFMRFWDAGSGKITFGGADIRSVNTATLRSQESFVTQDTELFADTIENNVRIANRNATHEQVVEACQKASLHDFITSLPQGYGTQVGELGGALSGGERQRIGVARAFLHDAPFVLMDEPTSNLDSLNEGVILKAVKEECRDKTVLLVSHRASTMAVANTVYSVESGRVS